MSEPDPIFDDEELVAAIRALPLRLRTVFVRATVLRMPLHVIAQDLHLSRRQTERRMQKALTRCLAYLESRAHPTH